MPLSDYTIGSVIGKGTYGEVSLVKHKKDRKQYVIKKVDIHNASAREQKAAEQEAKLLSQVRHPNIVSYKESFQGHDGLLYIVMAFCEGGDMCSRLKEQKGQNLEERQIVEWFVQIAMALQYLHDRHILHRDLKTQNIFLTKSKIIKVGDLGIARVLENASDMATTLIGTPYYMSPELFSNRPYSYKSDVWALGCCLYEMCTLKHAFNAKDMNSLVYKILKGKLPAMPKIYSDDLCDIIKSMLAQEPENRPSVGRLLRHSFIKKQIALFLEGTKNRQRKSAKIREGQKSTNMTENKSEASSKSDSGYSGMGSGEDSGLLNAVPSQGKQPENKGRPVDYYEENRKSRDRPERELSREEQNKNAPKKSSGQSRTEARSGHSQDVKDVKEKRKYSKESSHAQDERDCHEIQLGQEEKKARPTPLETDEDSRSDSSADRQKSSRSRPLPPKPPRRVVVDPDRIPDVKVSRERRRFKVSKQVDDKISVGEPRNDSKNSAESCGLTPKASSGNPTSARERRRQRERESMVAQSALPSSIQSPSSSSDKMLGPQLSSKGQGLDSVDGPPRNLKLTERERKSQNGIADHNAHLSGDSDLEENSLEEAAAENSHKPRRKESSDVNSLISALDTTLKFSEQRRSPDFDSEPQDEPKDEPGDISVSSGRLRDRIEFLRRDCIAGLGEADFQKACTIIDSYKSEEDVEVALVKLMGRVKFEKYGGKIWQLKFCETFKRS